VWSYIWNLVGNSWGPLESLDAGSGRSNQSFAYRS
jgi:hypothetical protein